MPNNCLLSCLTVVGLIHRSRTRCIMLNSKTSKWTCYANGLKFFVNKEKSQNSKERVLKSWTGNGSVPLWQKSMERSVVFRSMVAVMLMICVNFTLADYPTRLLRSLMEEYRLHGKRKNLVTRMKPYVSKSSKCSVVKVHKRETFSDNDYPSLVKWLIVS